MFETLTVGLLVSIVYGAVGYAVAKAKNDEVFDALKFAKTLLIGVILATAAGAVGVDVATVEGMSFVGFLTALLDKVAALFIKKKA